MEYESCTCPAFYGGKRPCKHLTAMIKVTSLIPVLMKVGKLETTLSSE